MPLEPGQSKAVISHNIEEMEKAGHPHKQAGAAALHKAYDSAHAAGILLQSPQGRALFLKRAKGDHAETWCFPGGSIEDGETPEQAAKRETLEETGRVVDGPLTEADTEGGFVTYRGSVAEEFSPTLNDEHTDFRWAPLTSPPEPTHPGVATSLQRLALATSLRGMDLREYDDNGWFTVNDNPLSGVGVYEYRESSIVKGGDPNKMVGVFRPPEELSNDECINSFHLMPWTDDHPSDLLGPKEKGFVPADEKGVRGVIGEKVYFKDGILYGNIKVFSETLARKIASGKRELSVGYHCQFVREDGVYQGKPYQYVQRNIRGNHVASVDKGKMGAAARVLDSSECCLTFSLDMSEEIAMPEKRTDEAAGSVDAETTEFIGKHAEDSFNSLVGELEKKGYSKEYATKIAGKVAAEKGKTGHHDSTETTTVSDKTEAEKLEEQKAKDRKAARDARDAKRAARDARRAKDEMTEEEESAEDAAEEAEDADEEKEEEKDESKEAKDRKSARDRRAGARDARKGARDRKAAHDAKVKDAKKEGMDAAEITALIESKASEAANNAAANARRDAIAAQRLYQRVSPLIGAFDHDEMSSSDMASYSLKKLGAPEVKGTDPVAALDYFLAGRGAQTETRQRSAQDSASGDDFVSKYVAAA